MTIRLVLFDLDDTLFPSTEAYQNGLRAAWKRLRKDRGLSWSEFDQAYQRARQDVKKRLGTSPAARNRLLYFKRLVEIVYGSPHPGKVLALMSAYNACWSTVDVRSPRRVLRQLARRFVLGVVTNQVGEMQMRKLARLDPDGRYLKVVVTSEEVGVEKPDPRIFREACRLADCRPQEAILVGDSWKDDVQGALKAGMRAVFLHSGSVRRSLPSGVHSLSRLEDLPKWLA